MKNAVRLALTLLSLIIFSCTQKNVQPDSRVGAGKTGDISGTTIPDDSLQPPVIIALDTLPPPRTTIIPKSAGGTFLNEGQDKDGNKIFVKVNLTPPVVKPALRGHSHFAYYNTDQGLAISSVKCSYFDHAGNLWLGTGGGGVSVYDGKTFKTYSVVNGLAHNLVFSIAEDHNGNMWFATGGGGVSKFDGVSFTNYTMAQGLGSNIIICVRVDHNGIIWFGTENGGLCRYDGKKFVSYKIAQGIAGDVISSVNEDKQGNLWIGTAGSGISKYDGRTFINLNVAQGLVNNFVRAIVIDSMGNTWFGTDDGLSKYDGKTFTNYGVKDGLPNSRIHCLTLDHKGHLWIGTDGGASEYDGINFTNYSPADGLADARIYCISEDKTGNMWFSTRGAGVCEYDGKAFSNYSADQGLVSSDIWTISEDTTGALWIGTNGFGILRFDGKTFTNLATGQGLSNNVIWCSIRDSKGNMWFASSQGNGINKYDGRSITNYTHTQGLINNYITCILEDKDRNLWMSTRNNGISRFDGKTFTNYTAGQGLTTKAIECMTRDSAGNLWLGSNGQGLYKFDGHRFTNYTTRHGLSSNCINSLCSDKNGNVFAGTANGVSCLLMAPASGKPGERKIASIVNYTKSNGLPDNEVNQLQLLPDGRLFIGTNVGLASFDPLQPPDEHGQPAKLEIFNESTGYPIKDVNSGQNCMFRDSKGAIWAGTGDAKISLVRLDPSAINRNTTPPRVVIENIKINRQNVCWYALGNKHSIDSAVFAQQEVGVYGKTLSLQEQDTIAQLWSGIRFDSISPWYPLPHHLVLPYKDHNVTFEFNCIEVSKHNLVNYQYKLEGYDKDWSPVLKKQEADYGNINEGTYTFRLKAQGPNGLWSEPVSYTFTVLAPWYRTWWAYMLYAVCGITLLVGIFRWRIAALKMRQKELQKMVRERTAELVEKNLVVEQQKQEIEREKVEVEKQKELAEQQYQRSEELLLNILPAEVAEELKQKGVADAKQFDEVTVLFTDFANFTKAGELMTPKQLVGELHSCFKAFDNICTKYHIEKIKTVGDAYLAVSGLPVRNTDHALNVVAAAMEIRDFMLRRKAELGEATFDIRIGINTGPVVAGIVGIQKFAYDIWGDTVNTAARMEQNSEEGKINISASTYEKVKHRFKCTYRGKIEAKNKGSIDMYFVVGVV